MRILIVCSGNICRSPTAEAVIRELARTEARDIEVDSAGTGAWHVGERPDERAREAAARRGLQLTGRARQVTPEDFDDFDHVIAVDEENLQRLRRIRPPGSHAALRTLAAEDIPDPYYGGPDGFDHVLDLITAAAKELLDDLRQD